MSDTPTAPTPEEAEIEYGKHLLWRMSGAKITAIGANEAGEIFLQTERDGMVAEVIIGKDENGEVAMFEVEKKDVPHVG